MKKKIAIGFGVLMLFGVTSVHAADWVKVTVSKIAIVVDGLKYSTKDPILNSNDRIYLPVREISEMMGAEVTYNAESDTAYFNNKSTFQSTVNSVVEENGLELGIYASKAEFHYGEKLEVWSRLTNRQQNAVEIRHARPMITFVITDSEGFGVGENVLLSLAKTTFQNNDEITRFLPKTTETMYALYKNDTIPEGRPSYIPLPKGDYKVQVRTTIIDEDNKELLLKAEIEISIV